MYSIYMRRFYSFTSAWLLFLLILIPAGLARAQQANEQDGAGTYAEYVNLAVPEGQEIQEGLIVELVDGEYRLAATPYSTALYGAVTLDPAVAVSSVGLGNTIFPAVISGITFVRVADSNGEIKRGDFITSSETPGVGMKLDRPGFALGVAQADFAGGEGLVPVSLTLDFAQAGASRNALSQLGNILDLGFEAVAYEPNTALRYILAAIVLIIAITFGLLTFGRSATNGVTAMGRNPLARRSIMAIVAFNVTMTVVFSGAGLVLAVFILIA